MCLGGSDWLVCCMWVFLNSFSSPFDEWRWTVAVASGRIMWKTSFLAVIWFLWRKRNSQCFEVLFSYVEELVDEVGF